MIDRTRACTLGFVLLTGAALGQAPSPTPAATPAPAAAAPAFDVADVHVARKKAQPFMQGGTLRGDRFFMHDATMVDLIATAYGVETDNVLGGPSWLERDRFDLNSKAPATTDDATVKLMLRTLLAERFKLVVHLDTKPIPAFLLTAKGNSKLKPSDGTGKSNCDEKSEPPPPPSEPGAPPKVRNIQLTCQNMTAAEIANFLHQAAGGYLSNPVIDKTGLKGTWDFDLEWTGRGQLAQAGADGISIFDAVDKQLGLKLEAGKAPVPVVIVDSANEKPTANAPGLEKLLPPPPPSEFEVAVIKPSAPGSPVTGRINGGQVDVHGFTLKMLIQTAWNLNSNDKENIVDAPKWMDDKKFDILAKVAPQPGAGNAAPQIEYEDLQVMLQKLLAERFEMKFHMEERPVNAYRLVAAGPKMAKADPLNRTGCKEGPGADGKDPRIASPILGRLITCHNMTMAQFGEELPDLANGYIFSPVVDATGLTAAYDFTLSFSPSQSLGLTTPTPNGAPAGDPSGAVSLFDAVSRQLGVKLEKEKRPVPVLVIEHIDETPIDN